MRLRKIKLAGFKSFVDPVTIPVSASLVGVVGPNGCGKSNIIDAIRWVMGESSAKNLRGDSMSDVIFSGSSARKPVSRASVELVFDNSDNRAPGQYAGYSEISIRREASRDGESEYFLNRVRCRRRDIMDLFLGTGLGARAYAIVEQGTISRIIESKPEDLRVLFDEAAGVSRYKERRRETENRMRHVRENLERVDDVRGELEGQLTRLQRQSRAAARYQELKEQERGLRADLLKVRAHETDQLIAAQTALLGARETELEQAIALQRSAEAALERLRNEEQGARDLTHELEGKVRATGAEIARIEQQIAHVRATRDKHVQDRELVTRDLGLLQSNRAADQARRAEIEQRIESQTVERAAGESQRIASAERLREAEQALARWRERWTEFTARAAEPEKRLAIESSRVRTLERQVDELAQRLARLQKEEQTVVAGLEDDASVLRQEVAEQDRLCETLALDLQRLDDESRDCRLREQQIMDQLSEARGGIQTVDARLASLEELQAAALGQRSAGAEEWLGAHLSHGARLGEALTVESGWEKAVEHVLGADLGAVIVKNLEQFGRDGATRSATAVIGLEAGSPEETARGPDSLLAKATASVDLAGLLSGVRVAESVSDAMAQRSLLGPGESVVTRDGVWCGRNWIRFPQNDSGVLVRAREMEALRAHKHTLSEGLQSLQAQLATEQQRHGQIDGQREQGRRRLAELNRERAGRHSALGQKEARLTQLLARKAQLRTETGDVQQRLTLIGAELEQARASRDEAQSECAARGQERQEIEAVGQDLERDAAAARAVDQQVAARVHQIDIERGRLQSDLAALGQGMERLDTQCNVLLERQRDIDALLAEKSPEDDLRAEIDVLLGRRMQVEAAAHEAASRLSEIETARRGEEGVRQREAQRAESLRTAVEDLRLKRQELVTKRGLLVDQAAAVGLVLGEAIEVPDPARDVAALDAEIAAIESKIERLGPINLAAISEYEEHAKRKEFLDSQHADLSQALASLDEAIRKIDRETRTRFRETFDRVNVGFQSFFPKLFGGGHASLELLGDDLLETGVTIMARPPGKRNSTIHLLSGGEKALTAVALIFAIFELNPAPFCLLDEVDAPLDDANVERYAQTLRTMSEQTQLLYITHNKVTMEAADLLLGVTMSEPGVSRLVSVDLEQAVRLVGDARQAAT